MPSDTIHAEQGLSRESRVRALRGAVSRLQALRDQAVRDLTTRKKEVEALTARLDVLLKVNELYRALMDRMVLDHVKSIESLVTEGLRTIFFDQKLDFLAEVCQRYNKVAIDFYFRQQEAKREVKGPPLEAFGGGPASVASLILRVLAILKLKKWPLLLLDETLAAVSDEYVDLTGQFLRRLSESTGIPILLITHKQSFLDHAKLAYSGTEQVSQDGIRHLELNKVKSAS